jgi:hypothetical protein
MNQNFNLLPDELLAKKEVLEQLATSSDGQKVKSMIDPDGALQSAYQRGDIAAMQRAVEGILNTEEGARLAKQLGDIMKN